MTDERLRLSAGWTWIGRASTAPLIGLIGLAVIVPAYGFGAPGRHRYALYVLAAVVAAFVVESLTNYDIRGVTLDADRLRLSWLFRRWTIPLPFIRVIGPTSLGVGRFGRLRVVELEYRLPSGRGAIVQFFPASGLSQALLEQAVARASEATISRLTTA
jgi:hypothetical protein